MFTEFIDKALGVFSPAWELNRVATRKQLELFNGNLKDLSQRRYFESGKIDRTTARFWTIPQVGDDPNLLEVQKTRERAWWLFHNNSTCNKVVRTIIGRILGSGLTPESLATDEQGSVHSDFRLRANQLWNRWQNECHILGTPGRGGMAFADMMAQVLREVIVSGECLIRFEPVSATEAEQEGLDVPLRLTIIEAERLYESYSYRPLEGKGIFRGIIMDNQTMKRVAYRIFDNDPWHPYSQFAHNWHYTDIPAEQVIHVYLHERPASLRGASWLAPVILNLRDISDYEYNEMVAALVSSCLVFVHTKNPQNTLSGLNVNATGSSVDDDGNKIERYQPGTNIYKAPGEDVQLLNPVRPNANAENFLSYKLRGISAGAPGVKSSTITGDYRQSSFSSEKSAENDSFYEIQGLQNWFIANCCQPIYSEFIERAILFGAFEGVEIPDDVRPQSRQLLYESYWHGPGTKSLNPMVDENAINLAIANGTMSLAQACLQKGTDYRKVVRENLEAARFMEEMGVPEWMIQQVMGAKQATATVEEDPADPNSEPDEDDFVLNTSTAAAPPKTKTPNRLTQKSKDLMGNPKNIPIDTLKLPKDLLETKSETNGRLH